MSNVDPIVTGPLLDSPAIHKKKKYTVLSPFVLITPESTMNSIISANPPLKGPKDRRATMDKSGINTKGTNIQVVLRCK